MCYFGVGLNEVFLKLGEGWERFGEVWRGEIFGSV